MNHTAYGEISVLIFDVIVQTYFPNSLVCGRKVALYDAAVGIVADCERVGLAGKQQAQRTDYDGFSRSGGAGNDCQTVPEIDIQTVYQYIIADMKGINRRYS